uniref:Uncharacterized protein n=1 Tax=Anguilla anguilla TaxID=7936 RepID=A0A0E9TZL3_ANGAN
MGATYLFMCNAYKGNGCPLVTGHCYKCQMDVWFSCTNL